MQHIVRYEITKRCVCWKSKPQFLHYISYIEKQYRKTCFKLIFRLPHKSVSLEYFVDIFYFIHRDITVYDLSQTPSSNSCKIHSACLKTPYPYSILLQPYYFQLLSDVTLHIYNKSRMLFIWYDFSCSSRFIFSCDG